MKYIFENRLAPITFSIGFLKYSLPDLALAYEQWFKRIGQSLSRSSVEGDLEAMLLQLPPLTTPPKRVLFIETNSPEWTAYFDNGTQGGDPAGPVGHLALTLRTQGVIITAIPDTIRGKEPGTYGATKFSMYGPEKTSWLNIERAVGFYNDGGPWKFILQGTQQDFEEPEHYTARRIRDRLPLDLLEKYCAAIGLHPFESAFYGNRGVMFRKNAPLPIGHPNLTLEEARKLLGLS